MAYGILRISKTQTHNFALRAAWAQLPMYRYARQGAHSKKQCPFTTKKRAKRRRKNKENTPRACTNLLNVTRYSRGNKSFAAEEKVDKMRKNTFFIRRAVTSKQCSFIEKNGRKRRKTKRGEYFVCVPDLPRLSQGRKWATAATRGGKGLRLRARINGKNKPAAGESVTGFVNTY